MNEVDLLPGLLLLCRQCLDEWKGERSIQSTSRMNDQVDFRETAIPISIAIPAHR
jgi:hypothetical protein